MTYRIAVDTGGTFTDVVVADEAGREWKSKAPTTHRDVFAGMLAALSKVSAKIGVDVNELLQATSTLTYATTHATNAIITGQTAKTAFLTTQGHPDVLYLREGGRFGPFNYLQDYPDPYIPRSLTFEIEERKTLSGEDLIDLNEDQVAQVAKELVEKDVEAVAVCFLWAQLYPEHELVVAEVLKRVAPHLHVSLSHQVAPIIREYRRASATAIDASLKPMMTEHFQKLHDQLMNRKFGGEVLTVTSTGGVVPWNESLMKPLLVVNSGPSIAPIGALAAAHDLGVQNDLIVGDMGGTTFDVSMIQGGKVAFARESWLGGQFVGHITGLPSVSVESIGYGGGSIARVDNGGMLRVGPMSAGSEPGPACFGRGGLRPTITDAAVVLGLIDPETFLGGAMQLDHNAASQAVQREIAGPLGLDLKEAAEAILEVTVDALAEETRESIARAGKDPADFVLVAGGGASGLCIGEVGKRLKCKGVLVPNNAPVLSASGGLNSDMVREFSISKPMDSRDFDFEAAALVAKTLRQEMDAFFDRIDTPESQRQFGYIVEARYRNQVWEIEVESPHASYETREQLEDLKSAFHKAHERTYGVKEPDQTVEFLVWRGRATAEINSISEVAKTESRDFRALQADKVPASERDRDAGSHDFEFLEIGREYAGPALIALDQSTLVVPAGMTLAKSNEGHLVLLPEEK